MKNKLFQDLNLGIGQLATCLAGLPKPSRITVQCIKDFNSAPNPGHIIDNVYDYIEISDGNLSTSHLISTNWTDEIWEGIYP